MTQLASMGGDTAADNEGGTGGETIAPEAYTLGDATGPLDPDALRRLDAWWRAANYLAVGQIYLKDNPLLREPLQAEHVKPRLLGHFGTVPGPQPRLRAREPADPRPRAERGLRRRPGPRRPRARTPAPGSRAPTPSCYSHIPPRRRGHGRRSSASSPSPAGCPATAAPETPGLLPRGRRARLLAAARVRRRARQPGPDRRSASSATARPRPGRWPTSWHAQQVRQPGPRRRRAAGAGTSTSTRSPTRRCWPGSPRRSCETLLRGYGYEPHVVAGDDPAQVHQDDGRRAGARASTTSPRSSGPPAAGGDADPRRPRRWPMIVLRTPKGWTCPPVVDGQQVEGTFRAHQVPLPAARTDGTHRGGAGAVAALLPAGGAVRRRRPPRWRSCWS